MMKAFARSDRGKVRASNQDNYLVSDGLYAVADGMGGHRGGETASRLAIETLQNALSEATPQADRLLKAVEAANRRVHLDGTANPELEGMGTTLDVLWEDGGKLLIAHVGDSRIYLLRGGELSHLTEDHSMVNELVKNGLISLETARTHPYRNIITKALGTDVSADPDILTAELLPGDRYLLCSDGLHGLVEDEEIKRMLSCAATPEEAAEVLTEAAIEAGGTDNITAVVCFAEEVPASC